MAIWEDISKNVKTAASAAVSKTEELGNIAKLKLAVSKSKSKLEKCYAKIGRLYYDFHKNGRDTSDELAALLSEADSIRADVKKLTDKLADLQKSAPCPQCAYRVPAEFGFCPKCGAKIEK